MNKPDITTIILTYNEELHIKRCLDRISPFVKEIFIIDCYSTDRTIEIAQKYENLTILQNKWVNYATQFNWALENAHVRTKWVLRLDADEYLSPELIQELNDKLPGLDPKYTGIVIPLQRVFLGRKINHGIARGIKMLRLFQYGKAKIETRQMDEHIELLQGESIEFKHGFVDHNLNNISWWAQKHIGYAKREAVDLLNIEFNLTESNQTTPLGIDSQAMGKRQKKERYSKLPVFWRSFIYFLYRYFFKMGFLDGKEGFLWDFMQGWWYRTLVDTNIYEIKKACGNDKEKIKEYLAKEYNIKV
ncbi:MAG: glycosyltransferase family 2 protein [Prevotella sp.]|nr:glycosyltransferase family 2 protein [Prevotella sp.]